MGRGGQKVREVVGEGQKGKKMLGETRVCKSLSKLSDEQLRKKANAWGLPEIKERQALLKALVSEGLK